MTNETLPPALAGQVERGVMPAVPKRGVVERLRYGVVSGWIVQALKVLDTLDPEDSAEADELRKLIAAGEVLALTTLANSKTPAEFECLGEPSLCTNPRGCGCQASSEPHPSCKTPDGCRENGCLGWCDEHKPEVATRCDGCAELRDQLREKAAWCDELERDAERYRFVRTADKVGISAEAARDPVAYDAAIDRAMERAKL